MQTSTQRPTRQAPPAPPPPRNNNGDDDDDDDDDERYQQPSTHELTTRACAYGRPSPTLSSSRDCSSARCAATRRTRHTVTAAYQHERQLRRTRTARHGSHQLRWRTR
jgi:hypothetical protein